MKFIINIYKKDSRTKSRRRIVDSYEFERKDVEAIEREKNKLLSLYKVSDGYKIEIVNISKTESEGC